MGHARSVFQPAITYLRNLVTGDLQSLLMAFRAVRVMIPSKAWSMPATGAHIDELTVLPFFQHDRVLLDQMKEELPLYLTLTEDTPSSVELLQWWNKHQDQLPAWAQAVRMVATLPPSSAAAERVFSLLKCMYNDQQGSLLSDAIEAAMMLRYNSRNFGASTDRTDCDLAQLAQNLMS
jgi:hypothetical protein